VHKFSLENLNLLQNFSQKKIQALILTSSNAADVAFDAAEILGLNKEIRIFAVGKKTAKKFLEANYKNVICSDKNSAEDLLKIILLDHEVLNKKNQEIFLYFCGEFVTIDFKIELEKAGIAVEKILSYKIIEEQSFSENFLAKIKNLQFDFVLLYSKNSAKHFYELSKKHNLLEYFQGSRILCLSEKILSVLRNFGFKNSATFDEVPILKKFYD
jgi:uroporphyrinogen-III synthase